MIYLIFLYCISVVLSYTTADFDMCDDRDYFYVSRFTIQKGYSSVPHGASSVCSSQQDIYICDHSRGYHSVNNVTCECNPVEASLSQNPEYLPSYNIKSGHWSCTESEPVFIATSCETSTLFSGTGVCKGFDYYLFTYPDNV